MKKKIKNPLLFIYYSSAWMWFSLSSPPKGENKIPSFIKKKEKPWQKVWEMDILSNGIYTSELMKFTPVLNADMRAVHF